MRSAGLWKRYGTQITWDSLAKDLSIDHPRTISGYVNLLEVMGAVFVQSALVEDKLVAAPKKARKRMFVDGFFLFTCNHTFCHGFFAGVHVWSRSILVLSVFGCVLAGLVRWFVLSFKDSNRTLKIVIDPLSLMGIFLWRWWQFR
jgi:hypothetical protein